MISIPRCLATPILNTRYILEYRQSDRGEGRTHLAVQSTKVDADDSHSCVILSRNEKWVVERKKDVKGGYLKQCGSNISFLRAQNLGVTSRFRRRSRAFYPLRPRPILAASARSTRSKHRWIIESTHTQNEAHTVCSTRQRDYSQQ